MIWWTELMSEFTVQVKIGHLGELRRLAEAGARMVGKFSTARQVKLISARKR